ncbi:hypothetical protein ANCDUO_00869 [Ancylostoma duodenale]|uniref:Uncharacterized protein n=1 Tax=Ancylostoma duodenale TaxID=51022 RepID=A0A0C2E0B8_9BILA|nr:hypothetical protein ANCDUO_00869 [Ancylostoma duodenale]
MDEARALRLHKQRLEHRSRILEQQNEQLELQLQRLRKVIEQQDFVKSMTKQFFPSRRHHWLSQEFVHEKEIHDTNPSILIHKCKSNLRK